MKKRSWILIGLLGLVLLAAGLYGGHTYQVSMDHAARERSARVRTVTAKKAAAQISQSEKKARALAKKAKPGAAQAAPVKSDRIPVSQWHQASAPVRFPILMYHDIGVGNTLMMPADQLKNQLTWLKQAGYYELTPSEAYTVLSTNRVPQDKIVWITFDDGYRAMATLGLPLFKATKSRVTVNEISGSVGSSWNLTEAMIKTMQAAGVDFASHTVSHLELNKLPAARQQTELTDSRTDLGKILGTAPNTIAYPVGRYNDVTLQDAKSAGYQLGLTTTPGLAAASQGLYKLDRVRVNPGNTLVSFMNLLRTGF
ncbi:polysaccharide deacetylase family protein [Schleiferilactobacillus shenzhenensis]|nr:polysaccharide deacetylase family protein [Schleiferilactobacillus shenzhenensis]